MIIYEIQYMCGWWCFVCIVCVVSWVEVECLCLFWEWVDGEVFVVILVEVEVVECWQCLNEDLVGSVEGLECFRWNE